MQLKTLNYPPQPQVQVLKTLTYPLVQAIKTLTYPLPVSLLKIEILKSIYILQSI